MGKIPTYVQYLKFSICSPQQLGCVKGVDIFDKTCLPQCSGVFITNVEDGAGKVDKNLKLDISKLYKQYQQYEYFRDPVAFQRGGLKKYDFTILKN